MKKLLPIILGLILTVSPVYGISSLTVTPSDPKVGDTISITGKANPNEEINCQIWFEINPMVKSSYYRYIMNDVEIPATPNNFKIVAENVIELWVGLKMGIWIIENTLANQDGVAVISKSNIPPGINDIEIGGGINDPEKPVKLKILISTKIKADENGNFKYLYRVNNIPEGTMVHLNIGGVKRDILIESSIPAPPPVDEERTVENHSNTANNTSAHKFKRENVIYGIFIKSGNAILLIPEGTRVRSDKNISIKEVNLPNTTLAYYISPRNTKFSKPLTLKIPYNISLYKKITVLYYDEHLRRWISIPYTCDENTITVKVSKSGYYAVKEIKNIENNNEDIFDKINSILDPIRIVITVILNYLQNIF